MATLFGSGIKRREDPRLITGKATYTDDVKLPGLLYAAVLRSTYAHARLKKVDIAKAKKASGVVAVYTGADLKDRSTRCPAPGTCRTVISRCRRIPCWRPTRCATWATASRSWWARRARPSGTRWT